MYLCKHILVGISKVTKIRKRHFSKNKQSTRKDKKSMVISKRTTITRYKIN